MARSPAPIVIRRLRSGDEANVGAATHLFDHPPDAAAVREFLADGQSYLIVAYASDSPVGFARAHLLPRLDARRRQLFLYEIGVACEFRRRGVARALVEHLKELGTAAGCDELFVLTSVANVAAMRLYAATGGERPADDDMLFVYPLAGGLKDAPA